MADYTFLTRSGANLRGDRHREAATLLRSLLASVESGEDVRLSRYGYGLLVENLQADARLSTSSCPGWGETRLAMESRPALVVEPLTPLD